MAENVTDKAQRLFDYLKAQRASSAAGAGGVRPASVRGVPEALRPIIDFIKALTGNSDAVAYKQFEKMPKEARQQLKALILETKGPIPREAATVVEQGLKGVTDRFKGVKKVRALAVVPKGELGPTAAQLRGSVLNALMEMLSRKHGDRVLYTPPPDYPKLPAPGDIVAESTAKSVPVAEETAVAAGGAARKGMLRRAWGAIPGSTGTKLGVSGVLLDLLMNMWGRHSQGRAVDQFLQQGTVPTTGEQFKTADDIRQEYNQQMAIAARKVTLQQQDPDAYNKVIRVLSGQPAEPITTPSEVTIGDITVGKKSPKAIDLILSKLMLGLDQQGQPTGY